MCREASEWVNTLFALGLSSSFIVANISEHFPPQPQCNNKATKARPQHPTLYDKRVGFFTSPANHNIEDAGDGAYGL